MTALMISVTGIGISLAREEFRCYLGLVSAACNPSEINSTSPTENDESISNQEVTRNSESHHHEAVETKSTFNAKPSDSLSPKKLQNENQNTPAKETLESDSKFISVEELSRIPAEQPDVDLYNTVPPGNEGYVGIPIEVEPFNEGNN
ncbi:hypothetical protein [Crocosphaera sp. Alani8]